jgi:hypothetical protein
MPILLVVGTLLILAGLSLLVFWFQSFWIVFKAFVPLAVVGLGGTLAYFGWEERKERLGAFLEFSSLAEASRYQAEALAYQEKLNTIQEEPSSLEVEPTAQPTSEPKTEEIELDTTSPEKPLE